MPLVSEHEDSIYMRTEGWLSFNALIIHTAIQEINLSLSGLVDFDIVFGPGNDGEFPKSCELDIEYEMIISDGDISYVNIISTLVFLRKLWPM